MEVILNVKFNGNCIGVFLFIVLLLMHVECFYEIPEEIRKIEFCR